MIYGVVDGRKIKAEPDLIAYCPVCNSRLRPKCGEVNTWHWSHIARDNCPHNKPETEWHLKWKSFVPAHRCEVVIKKGGIVRVADIVLNSGKVVEFQHSSISSQEIRAREDFYQDMVWVFDCIKAYQDDRFIERPNDGYSTFRWKHPKKTLSFCRRKVFLDFGPKMFRLDRIYPDAPCGGYGQPTDKRKFINWISAFYNLAILKKP